MQKSRQIDLSKSSKELIKINLKDKKSNFEKNGKIREIIKNNINNSKKKHNISKKFYKKYLTASKDAGQKYNSFFNKIKTKE